jgi:molecular chaperone GrpE
MRHAGKLAANPTKKTRVEDETPPSVEAIQKDLDEALRQREESRRKADEYFGKLQRLQADMENLQKVTKRQLDSAIAQASEKLLVNLLPVLDSLQQAENMAHSSNSLPPDEIAVGLGMLRKQLAEILFTEGLKEIPAVGHPLDPERHEVVGYVETDEEPENIIVEEVRKGYLLNGRVIRPSLVVVSKPKTPEEKAEKTPDSD